MDLPSHPLQFVQDPAATCSLLSQLLRCVGNSQRCPGSDEAQGQRPRRHSHVTSANEDLASFEDQMKALVERERRVRAFNSAWVGQECPQRSFGSLLHFTRDPFQEDCGRLVAELVQDRLLDAAVFAAARTKGACVSLYQILNPLAPCEPADEEDEEDEEEEEEAEELEEDEEQEEDEEEEAERSSSPCEANSWLDRASLSAWGPSEFSDNSSKAAKDKEVLSLFQSLKLSLFRKGQQ